MARYFLPETITLAPEVYKDWQRRLLAFEHRVSWFLQSLQVFKDDLAILYACLYGGGAEKEAVSVNRLLRYVEKTSFQLGKRLQRMSPNLVEWASLCCRSIQPR